jgi:hypothetical protein
MLESDPIKTRYQHPESHMIFKNLNLGKLREGNFIDAGHEKTTII